MSLSIRTFLVFLVMGFGIGVLISCLSSRSREAQSQVPEQNVSPLADGKDTVQSRLDRRLDWSELVSTNLERYVSNLRGIKCPEDLVEAILRAEVEYSYLPRVLALNHPTKFIADPIPRMKVRSTEQAKLRTEIDEILYEKLRIDRPVTDSALFSAEEERQILYASTAFPNFPVDPTNPTSSALSQSNKLRRIDYLSQYLSPEGLTYYKLDREKEAGKVALLLRGLQPTKAEFLAICTAIEDKDMRFRGGHFEPAVQNALKEALGSTRYDQLLKMRQPEYAQILDFATLHRLSPSVQNQLTELRTKQSEYGTDTYLRALTNILRNPSLIGSYLERMQSWNPQADRR